MGINGLPQQAQKTEVKGYIQGPLTLVKMPKMDTIGNIGIKTGVQVEKNAFHAGVEAGIGANIFQTKAEAGHKFDLGNNWDLDLTGKTEYKTQLGRPNEIKHYNTTDINGTKWELDYQNKWSYNEIRLGAKAEAQYTTGQVKLGAGIEGGFRGNTLGDVSLKHEVDITDNQGNNFAYNSGVNVDKGHRGLYLTPTVSAEMNIGKSFSLIAKGDIYQGEAGVRFTF